MAATSVPQDYAAALQVSQGLGAKVREAEARTMAARDGCYPATVAYLEACDSGSPDAIRWAKHDLHQCVLRAQAEEKLLEQAQAEHQKAARLAEALLARSAA